MVETTRKRLSSPERRTLIEIAAARLFAEHGYTATRLNDIAAAAGVTKPVLYRHFRSKKDLHLALLAKHRDELLGQIVEHIDQTEPMLAQLPKTLDAWFGYVEEHPYAWKMLFADTTGDPEIRAFHEELHASARALTLALIQADGDVSIPAREIEPMAELIRSATTGLALWWLEHPEVERRLLVEVMSRTMDALAKANRAAASASNRPG
jgi:AcrR family transcriptional regulator